MQKARENFCQYLKNQFQHKFWKFTRNFAISRNSPFSQLFNAKTGELENRNKKLLPATKKI